MTFREKMLWLTLATTLAIWGWYFAGFLADLRVGHFDPAHAIGGFVATVILLVIVHVVTATVVAVVTGRDVDALADDRERSFALAAYRPAYFMLSGLVVMLMLGGPVLLRFATHWAPAFSPDMAPILLGNALLASLVLAEIVHAGAQIIRLRTGG